jgi:hypothetical protein
MSPRRGSKLRRTDRLVVGRNVTLTLMSTQQYKNYGRRCFLCGPCRGYTLGTKPGLTDRLVVGRKVTLTLTNSDSEVESCKMVASRQGLSSRTEESSFFGNVI